MPIHELLLVFSYLLNDPLTTRVGGWLGGNKNTSIPSHTAVLTAWKPFACLLVCPARNNRRYSFRYGTADTAAAVLKRHLQTIRTPYVRLSLHTYAHCRTQGNSYVPTKHTFSRFPALLYENVSLCTLLSSCVNSLFCIPRWKKGGGGGKETPGLTFKQPRSYIRTHASEPHHSTRRNSVYAGLPLLRSMTWRTHYTLFLFYPLPPSSRVPTINIY